MGTKAELRNRTAGMLGRNRLGQAMNDALKVRLDEAYDVVYADLKDEQLTIWSSADGAVIPDGVIPHVAALMAFDAIDDVAVSDARLQRIIVKEIRARPAIRRIVAPQYESLEEPEDF